MYLAINTSNQPSIHVAIHAAINPPSLATNQSSIQPYSSAQPSIRTTRHSLTQPSLMRSIQLSILHSVIQPIIQTSLDPSSHPYIQLNIHYPAYLTGKHKSCHFSQAAFASGGLPVIVNFIPMR